MGVRDIFKSRQLSRKLFFQIIEGGFYSNITRNGFAEYKFQSSLGLDIDAEPGFESRVWTGPHN